jgi:hypothetical protein
MIFYLLGKISGRAKGMEYNFIQINYNKCTPVIKMIFLTATPIFDNIVQLKELVKL